MSKNPKRFALLVSITLILAGCFAGSGNQIEPAYYDLSGSSMPASSKDVPVSGGGGLALRLAEVRAPAWLNTSAIQYRLAYDEPERRLSFAESRWVASPAELLEQALQRNNVVRKTRYEAAGCQLHVDLDEFIQSFDAPGSSRALIEVRVSLLAPRNTNTKLLAQKTFRLSPVAGSNARSGVAGFVVAVRELNLQMNDWLAQLERDNLELKATCRS